MSLLKLINSKYLTKNFTGLCHNLSFVGNLVFLTRTFSNEPKFNFTISKFNDIHIQSDSVVKLMQQIDLNADSFEKILISKSILFESFIFKIRLQNH